MGSWFPESYPPENLPNKESVTRCCWICSHNELFYGESLEEVLGECLKSERVCFTLTDCLNPGLPIPKCNHFTLKKELG